MHQNLAVFRYIKKVLQFWSQVDRHADSVFLNAKIEDF